jgi:predicted nucleic acid-binding protein
VVRDRNNYRAKALLGKLGPLVTTDHIVVETWLLLSSRYHRRGAEAFWDVVRRGAAQVEKVTDADMDAAWTIGEVFADQEFSIVDRTSFAVMERLGITRAASFDKDSAVYRYGRNRDRAFEILG